MYCKHVGVSAGEICILTIKQTITHCSTTADFTYLVPVTLNNGESVSAACSRILLFTTKCVVSLCIHTAYT